MKPSYEKTRMNSVALINGLRKRVAFCDLHCTFGPSPVCNTIAQRHSPCSLKGYIAETTETLSREFGIEVDRVALVNESKELERARRDRQTESSRRLREFYVTTRNQNRGNDYT